MICLEQKKKTKTISIEFEEESCDPAEPHGKTKFQIETVAFVAGRRN